MLLPSVFRPVPAVLAGAAMLWLGGCALPALAQTGYSYTAGNLVLSRVGNTASVSSTTNATPVYLDQYTTAGGVPVSTNALPTTASGSNHMLTESGLINTGTNASISEGALTLSTGGDYLTIQGYDTAVSATNGSSTADGRVIARIGANGNIDTTTVLTSAYSGSATTAGIIRSSVYDDKSGTFYISGMDATAGVRSAKFGATAPTASTPVETAVASTRDVGIFNGQLYASIASGISKVTSNGLTPVVSDTSSAYGFVFTSPTTLYVADANTGLLKYTSVDSGASFTLTSTFGGVSGLTGLTATTNALGQNVLYTVNSSTLYSFTDTGTNITFTSLAKAPTYTAFRGVAFAPVALTPAPDPSGLVSTGIGFGMTGLGMLLRRRRATVAGEQGERAKT